MLSSCCQGNDTHIIWVTGTIKAFQNVEINGKAWARHIYCCICQSLENVKRLIKNDWGNYTCSDLIGNSELESDNINTK